MCHYIIHMLHQAMAMASNEPDVDQILLGQSCCHFVKMRWRIDLRPPTLQCGATQNHVKLQSWFLNSKQEWKKNPSLSKRENKRCQKILKHVHHFHVSFCANVQPGLPIRFFSQRRVKCSMEKTLTVIYYMSSHPGLEMYQTLALSLSYLLCLDWLHNPLNQSTFLSFRSTTGATDRWGSGFNIAGRCKGV